MPDHTYFFGRHRADVYPEPQTFQTFLEFVRYIDMRNNNWEHRHMTMSEYHAMAEPDGRQSQVQKDIKNGPYFLPCKITPGGQRNDLDVERMVLICLDVDDPSDARELLAVRGFRMIRELENWRWCAYTTLSSTPEKPRLRVVVGCDLLPEDYWGAVHTVANRLGVQVTSESRVLSQPMFLPKWFLDAPREMYIRSDDNRRAFVSADIDQSLEVPTRIHRTQDDDFTDTFEPVEEVNPAVLREALFNIDSSCSREDWVKVCCALKHYFQNNDEEGYSLFDQWSARGSNYEGQEDTRRQWDYEEANPTVRPITIRTLFHMARQAGWQDPRDNTFDNLRERVLCASSESELEEIFDSIRNAVLTSLEREKIEKLVQQQYRNLDISLGIAAIRRALRPTGDIDIALPRWLDGWYFVAGQDQVYNCHTQARNKVSAFNLANNSFTMNEDTRAADLLTMDPTRVVDNYTCIPHDGDRWVVNDPINGGRCVNTYRPMPTRTSQENFAEVAERIDKHLLLSAGNERNAEILRQFLAYIVQYPDKRVNWAILLQGVQGSGKTFLSAMMGAVLGHYAVSNPTGSIVSKDFTSWAEGKRVVSIEEIRVSGQNRWEVMDKLKPFITNDIVNIRRMRTDPYDVPNISNYLLFTNHHDSIAITDGERRYCYFKGLLQRPQHVSDLNHEYGGDGRYFSSLYALLRRNPATFRYYWKEHVQVTREFKAMASGNAPLTTDTEELVENSRSESEQAIRTLLHDQGVYGCNHKVVSTILLRNALDMHPEFSTMRLSGKKISSTLQHMGYIRIRTRQWPSGEREGQYRHTVLYNPDTVPNEEQAIQIWKEETELATLGDMAELLG